MDYSKGGWNKEMNLKRLDDQDEFTIDTIIVVVVLSVLVGAALAFTLN